MPVNAAGGGVTPSQDINKSNFQNLATPDDLKPSDGSADHQSMIDNTEKMLQEQMWMQQFAIETNLRSQEIKTLADALKGVIQKMA